MTDLEHAAAIAEAHERLMQVVRAAWEAGLQVDAELTPLGCGPWSLSFTVRRTTLLGEGRSISQQTTQWWFATKGLTT